MPEPTPHHDPTQAAPASSFPSFTESGSDTLGGSGGAPPVPAHVGEYRVLGELGRGGMGVVYRAEDPRLKREVALKVMLPQFATRPQAKARFVREARAQARVEHDHVAVIHQVAEHDGLPYLVMPLLKGLTLHQALRANPRPPLSEVIRIGREIAEGLAAAHEKGLVHRDIKPANVWLEGKKLRVKVLDFGLARGVDSDATEQTDAPLTREGTVVGTPAYMSPEQGRGLPVDARTDLWSLGVVLYQMTSGELPFTGANTLGVLTSLAVDNPPAPAERNPSVPPQLSDLVMRLLSKTPTDRPADAESVADELRAIEAGLTNAVRVIPLDAPPIVLASGPDPFAELDATEANTGAEAAPAARREGARGTGEIPLWAYAAVAVLVGAGLVAVAVQQLGKKPQPEVVKEEPPKPTPPIVRPPDKLPPPEREEREALEAIHPHATLLLRLPSGEKLTVPPSGTLPAGPFELIEIAAAYEKPVPPDFVANTLAALARQKSLIRFTDPMHKAPWTEDEFARLARTPVRLSLAGFDGDLELTPGVVELLKGFPKLGDGIGLRARTADDALLAQLAAAVKVQGGLFLHDLGREGKVTEKGWAAVTALPLSHLGLMSPRGPDRAACELIARMPDLTLLAVLGGDLDDAGLKAIGRRTSLKHLELHGTNLPRGGVAHLTGLKSLIFFRLDGTSVADDDAKHLAELKSLLQLNLHATKVEKPESIELLRAALPRCEITWGGKIYEPSDPHTREAMRFLARTGSTVGVKLADGKVVTAKSTYGLPDEPFVLAAVTLSGPSPPFTDADLKRLESTPTLSSLELTGAAITDGGLRSLLPSKDALVILYLGGCARLTDEGLRVVGELANLTHVNLDGVKITDDGLRHLAGLKHLEGFSANETSITDAALKHLAALPKLRSLYLPNTALTDAGVEALAGMKGLKELYLSGTRVTGAGLGRLRAALPECKIDWEDPHRYFARYFLGRGTAITLDLKLPDGKEVAVGKSAELPAGPFTLAGLTVHAQGHTFTDADLKRLEATPTLVRVGLGGTSITDAGLKSLLASKATLERLYAPSTRLTDAGLPAVGELDGLVDLALGNVPVTDAGVKHLAGLTRLRRLYLDGTPVGDGGLKHLAGLPLGVLQLSGSAVSDAGVEALAGMKGLVELGLRGTRITEAGYEKLQAALPKCKIDWEPPKKP